MLPMNEPVKVDIRTLREKAGPFPPQAFQFIRDGLAHAVRMVHGENPAGPDRHVSGRQLCLALRDFAVRRYGMLARTVLEHWGIRRTDDFGRIVYGMIAAGLLRASEQDSIEDFRGVYDFDEAFPADEFV